MDNRSKRSVVLDLSYRRGAGAPRGELLSTADVFLTNVRPGRLRAWLELDFETVAAAQSTPGVRVDHRIRIDREDPARPRNYDVAPRSWARAGLADLLTRPEDTPPFQRGGMRNTPRG